MPNTLPPEWHPHEAIWLAYPHDPTLWAQNLLPAQAETRALISLLSESENINLLTPIPIPNVHSIPEPYGDIWLRDTGPIFLHTSQGTPVAACFAFNGWGQKYLLPNDANLNLRLANRCASRAQAQIRLFDFVLEGGAIDTDGTGTLLTTRQCLLNPNRSRIPGQTPLQATVEANLRHALGAQQIIWLDNGLQNDHTDGHVDTLARFVAPGEVVCMRPSGAADPNAAALTAIEKTLRQARDASGRRLQVHTIPSPGAVCDADGRLAPASYLNFIIGNGCVAVPTYGRPQDAAAVAELAALFVGRSTHGLSARAILSGGGAFHCMSQQQPAPRAG